MEIVDLKKESLLLSGASSHDPLWGSDTSVCHGLSDSLPRDEKIQNLAVTEGAGIPSGL